MSIFGERRPAVRLLIVGAALSLLSIGLGYLVGRSVRSPGQVLAETAPPPRTVLTAPVTRSVVTRSIAFDAHLEPRFSTDVGTPASGPDGAGVITRLPIRVGQVLGPGNLVAEVSGRPVIVLPGRLPAYRTLQPGASGPDVRQLQQALTRAGLAVTDPAGYFGPSTGAATTALYARLGYRPAMVGTEDVAAAAESVRAAERTWIQARADGASSVELGFDADDLARARAALARAEARRGPQLPVSEVVFVPSLPARIAKVQAGLGAAAGGVVATLVSGPLVVRGTPVDADAAQIRPGMPARLLLTPTGTGFGRVSGEQTVAAQSGTVGGAGGDAGAGPASTSVLLTITAARALRGQVDGAPVRAIVTVQASPQAGLTVPITALSEDAAGMVSVTVTRGGAQRRVLVTPGFTGDGSVQVAPVTHDALGVGDQVVVGVSGSSG